MRNKINVMNRQPDITDEELERFKNFDALLDKHQQLLNDKKPASWKIIIPSILIIGTIIGYLVMSNNSAPAENHATASPDSVTLLHKKENVPAVLPEPEKEKIENTTREKSVVAKTDTKRSKSSVEQKADSAQAKELQSTTPPAIQSNPDPISPPKPEMVYVQAEPVEGYEALYAYFAKEIIYPQEAVKDSIQGVLTVTFFINKQGKPEKIKTSGSLGKPFEAEAVRLIENMPLWKPATLNGQPVTSKLSIPLTFQLQKK